jgi:uridine kinase
MTVRDQREQLLQELSSRMHRAHRAASPDVLRVAVDGVDGAGKTVFADEVAARLRALDLEVVRAGVDGFHNPPALRYRRGRDDPDGFYLDSYDYAGLRRQLLDRLGPGGDRRIVRAVYDVHREAAVETAVEVVTPGSVLIFDGIFLHRPELRDVWDLSIYLDVPFEVSIPRGAQRGYGDPDPGAPSNRRYVDGQRRYLATCDPAGQATWVVDNTDLARPVLRATAAPPRRYRA